MSLFRRLKNSFKKKQEPLKSEGNPIGSGHYLHNNEKIDGQNINPEQVQKSAIFKYASLGHLPTNTACIDNPMDNGDNGHKTKIFTSIFKKSIKKLSLKKTSAKFITELKIDPVRPYRQSCYFTRMFEQLTRNITFKSEFKFDDGLALRTTHPLVLGFSSKRDETLFLTKNCQTCNENDSICIFESFNNKLLNDVQKYFNFNNSANQLKKLSFYLNGNDNLSNLNLETFIKFCKIFGTTITDLRFLTRYEDILRHDWFSNILSSISQ